MNLIVNDVYLKLTTRNEVLVNATMIMEPPDMEATDLELYKLGTNIRYYPNDSELEEVFDMLGSLSYDMYYGDTGFYKKENSCYD